MAGGYGLHASVMVGGDGGIILTSFKDSFENTVENVSWDDVQVFFKLLLIDVSYCALSYLLLELAAER